MARAFVCMQIHLRYPDRARPARFLSGELQMDNLRRSSVLIKVAWVALLGAEAALVVDSKWRLLMGVEFSCCGLSILNNKQNLANKSYQLRSKEMMSFFMCNRKLPSL